MLKVAKALSSEIRLHILEYLLEVRIANKSDIMDHFNIERATLDHHLKPLLQADLVGQIEVIIDKVKNILCVPLKNVELKMQNEVDAVRILEIIGDNISIDIDHQEIQNKVQREVRLKSIKPEDAKAIIRTIFFTIFFYS